MRRVWLVIVLTLALDPAVRAQPAPPAQFAVDADDAAVAACNASGFAIAAVVVDSLGAPLAESEGAGAPDTAEERAHRKARTAALFQISSGEVSVRVRADPAVGARLVGDATFLAEAGGVPVTAQGRIIGAIGVDGAPTAADDETCARAALAKVGSQLK